MLDNCELDRCGVTLLAGMAFGAVAATELLRGVHGGPIHELIDLGLKSPAYRNAG